MGFLLFLALYAYIAYSLQTIAGKTGAENTWLAWIPVANIYLMIKIAMKPVWWLILVFIPIVNIVVAVLLWMRIAEVIGKPSWLGLLVLVPIANFVLPGYLAFSK
jgi:hypothetical protein